MVQILSGLGKRASDGKDDHVVCSMSSPLRITFRLLHNDPTEVSGPAPAPHCSEIYMSVLDAQLQSSSQKLVLSFYDSLIFIYIYSQTLLLLSTHNHLSSLTAHSTAWTSTTRARIIKPTVLRHTIWVHANITIPFETLMPRGQFTRTLRGAIRSLTQRVSVSHFKIVLRPKGAIRHAGLTPCSRFLLGYLSINPHNSYLTRTCLPQILPVLACKRKNPSPPRHSLH